MSVGLAGESYKSPGDMVSECLKRKGPSVSRTSSIQRLAGKVSSVSLKVAIDPSAPPPLYLGVSICAKKN